MKIKNYKKHVLLFLFAFTFAIAICGTTTAANVNGTISDYNTVITGNVIKCSDSTSFSGVNISVSDNKKVLVSTITDENGYYSVAFNSNKKSFGVTASYPGHESSTETVKVVTNNSGQKTGKADFQLGPQKATVVGLKSGYYKEIYFEDYYDDSSSAGTISVTINGVSYDAYCIDLFTDIYPDDVLLVNGALVANGTGNLPSGVDWSKVNYIVHTYSADGVINGSKDKAINGAAIQSAIWYFTTAQYGKYSNKNKVKYQFMTDPMDNNYDAKLTSGSNKAVVRNLAQYIINQANTVTFYYPVLITINPQSATLHNGDTQTITATVYDQNNNPLQGVNVSFSTDRGSLSSASGTTNTQGQVTVNLTTGGLNSGIANILAWVTGNYGTLLYYDPTGTKLQDLTTTTTVPYSIQAASTITFAKKADVTITKTTSNPTPNVGQQFYYTITLNNSGPDDASNVQVTDTIPEWLTFNYYTSSIPNSYNNGVWTVGTLASGSTATLNLFVTPTSTIAGETLTNTATETQTEYDPTPATASVNIHVPKADVSITKTTSNPTPKVGQQFYYTITLTNNGPNTATNIQVYDNIPPEYFTFNNYNASQGSYSNGVWTVGTLDITKTATLNIYITPTTDAAGQTITNTATETHPEYNSKTNTAQATVSIPAITLTKTGYYNAYCDKLVWTISAQNNSNASIYNMIINDQINANSGTKYWKYYVSYDNGAKWVQDGTYNSTTGEWTINELPSGSNYLLSIYATPLIGTSKTYTNAATYNDQSATASVFVPNNKIDISQTGEYNSSTSTKEESSAANQIIWTITVNNSGKDAANFTVWDQMGYDSPDTKYSNYRVSYDNGATWVQDGSYDPETGAWNVTGLDKGETFIIEIYATPLNGSGTYYSTAVTSTNQEAPAEVKVP